MTCKLGPAFHSIVLFGNFRARRGIQEGTLQSQLLQILQLFLGIRTQSYGRLLDDRAVPVLRPAPFFGSRRLGKTCQEPQV